MVERQACAEIEITPAMVSAGVDEFCRYSLQDDPLDVIVEGIFTQMLAFSGAGLQSSDRSL